MHISDDYRTLFALLSSSLWQNCSGESTVDNLTGSEWQKLTNNAAFQGVFALAFDALPKAEALPPGLDKASLIRWGLGVQRLEDRNRRQREALKELISLFREHGMEVLLLKGLGLAENYPHPAHRECGDIDIYLFGDYERGNQIIEKQGIKVNREGKKHSTFFFKGIPVENHLSFLDVASSKTNVKLEAHLTRILKEQGYCTFMIENIEIRVPTPDFTAIFLTRHDITHFLASGLVLRHYCDLALFFTRNAGRIDFGSFRKIMTEEHQFTLFCAFMELARRYLGMPDNALPFAEPDGQVMEKVLNDTLNNKHRAICSEEWDKMGVPKRKVMGAIHLLNSKWKYSLAGKGEFHKRLVQSVKALVG